LIVFPQLSDIQRAFPNLDPRLLGHDIAYPAMLTFLPAGFIGLVVGGLIAANSSTILTHLNWGASYLVHDFYRRFIRKDAGEKHYVFAGRVATVGLFFCASGMVFLLDTAKDAFDIILQVGAGTGLLYLVRWFWWRVNAWCEVVAMASSFLVSMGILVCNKLHAASARNALLLSVQNAYGGQPELLRAKLESATSQLAGLSPFIATHEGLVITILITTICWLATTFLAPQTDRRTLIEFYRKVRPFGPGWACIRREAGVSDEEARTSHESIPLALLGWTAGTVAIWSSLFTVGNVLYGRWNYAILLSGVFLVSGLLLLHVMNRLWGRNAHR
jgi:Na+/proline symporter